MEAKQWSHFEIIPYIQFEPNIFCQHLDSKLERICFHFQQTWQIMFMLLFPNCQFFPNVSPTCSPLFADYGIFNSCKFHSCYYSPFFANYGMFNSCMFQSYNLSFGAFATQSCKGVWDHSKCWKFCYNIYQRIPWFKSKKMRIMLKKL